ncbi:hypothetical protein Neosp_012290 [[Neocosmospora] mangrovei]
MEHYQLKEWNEYLKIGPPKRSVPEYYYADGGSEKEILPPSMITVREGHDESLLGVQNFAVEFDPSWNRFFPDKIYTLKEEKSARGYLAKMLEGLAGCSFWTKLWLIDKKVRWSASPGKELGPVFYDYDGEYVQIDVSDTLPDPNSEEREPHGMLHTKAWGIGRQGLYGALHGRCGR